MVFKKKDSMRGQSQAATHSPSATCRSLRGQAAMEYLMTYGWAILVIVIVLAVLLFLNPFKAPETCLFQQPGFSCSDATVPLVYADSSNNVHIAMQISNKMGQPVIIHKVVCTTAAIGDVTNDFEGRELDDKAGLVSSGATADFTTNGKGVLDCTKGDGTPVVLSANSQFKGVVSVWYNYENDPDENIQRQASATLISTVLQQ